jgi:hypothetical protein
MRRHTMRKIREVLRLKYELDRTQREIEASTGLSKGSVNDYLGRASRAGLTWEIASELSEAEVEARLFQRIGQAEPPARSAIDFEWAAKTAIAIAVNQEPLVAPPRLRSFRSVALSLKSRLAWSADGARRGVRLLCCQSRACALGGASGAAAVRAASRFAGGPTRLLELEPLRPAATTRLLPGLTRPDPLTRFRTGQ